MQTSLWIQCGFESICAFVYDLSAY